MPISFGVESFRSVWTFTLLLDIFESTADRVFLSFVFVFIFWGTGRLHTVHFCTLECSSSILVFALCYLHVLFPFSNKSYGGPNIVTPGRQHLRCAYNLLFSLQYYRPSKYSTDFSWKCQQIDFPDLQRQVRMLCIFFYKKVLWCCFYPDFIFF